MHGGRRLTHGAGQFGQAHAARRAAQYFAGFERLVERGLCARGAIGRDGVLARMRGLLAVMRGGVRLGLAGTEYADRILPRQSHRFAQLMEERRLLALEAQGADHFVGLPSFDVSDLLRTDGRGRGLVHVLAADKLMMRPKLYATFLLWLLSELFENLPELGDPEKPKLVFFFDEAHLLFTDAPPVLVQKIEQVVRLIRSKGVGVYFVTQNPLDLPETVLGQLGNRVQHALRAFTPRDQKAVRAAAETFRQNPALDTAKAITELAVGEALVSFLDAKGTPEMVERALVEIPGVSEAAVFGIPHPDLGEEVMAVVVSDTLTPARLRKELRPRLASFAIPSRWHVQRDPLPVNQTGKVDKPALRAAFAFFVAEHEEVTIMLPLFCLFICGNAA